MFMPLSLLSYASILGIISTLMIIAVILIDGFSKREGPGSLWSPAEISFGVNSGVKLGVSFGLFMAGVRSSRDLLPILVNLT
jgi:vesicular inhibitory amino acid transporter